MYTTKRFECIYEISLHSIIYLVDKVFEELKHRKDKELWHY